MRDRGEVRRGTPRTEDHALPPEFWEAADLLAAPKTSVHLKLEPEVFEFFKQNVLAAYVRARRGQSR
jgi:hypothetical protein